MRSMQKGKEMDWGRRRAQPVRMKLFHKSKLRSRLHGARAVVVFVTVAFGHWMLQSSYLNLSSFLAGSRLVKQPRSAGSACVRAVVVLITVVFRDNKEEPRCRDPRTGHQPSLLALPVWHVIVLLSQSKCVRGCSLWPLNVGILVPVVA